MIPSSPAARQLSCIQDERIAAPKISPSQLMIPGFGLQFAHLSTLDLTLRSPSPLATIQRPILSIIVIFVLCRVSPNSEPIQHYESLHSMYAVCLLVALHGVASNVLASAQAQNATTIPSPQRSATYCAGWVSSLPNGSAPNIT